LGGAISSLSDTHTKLCWYFVGECSTRLLPTTATRPPVVVVSRSLANNNTPRK